MGPNFCGLRSSRAKQDQEKATEISCGGLRSLWAAMKVKKRQSHHRVVHGRVQEINYQLKNKINNNNNTSINHAVITLEDLIISSPGFSKVNYANSSCSSDSNHSYKQSSASSRKIHPSFDESGFKDNSIDIASMKSNEDHLVEINGGKLVKNNSCSGRRSKSGGKMKKKVSFRSPEVADIFVLGDSPPVPAPGAGDIICDQMNYIKFEGAKIY